MTTYEVYATRYDDPHVIEPIPARGLSFSLPVSDHGDCSFTATVEPGKSLWRDALGLPMSGILVARDAVPVWAGWLRSERPSGPRSFSFQAREWGSFFETCPARPGTWLSTNDHVLFRDQVTYAQAQPGQNIQVQTGTTLGKALSDRTVNDWDNATAEGIFRQIAEAQGGPEWYFGVAGSLSEPVRQLVLGDWLGSVDPVDVLMFVEDTQEWRGYDPPPTITLLGDLYPAGTTVPALSRRGGNVIAQGRAQDIARAGTVAIALGDGTESEQKRATAEATALLNAGWPRMTRWKSYSSVVEQWTLQRHADADRDAVAGITTAYDLVTLDGDPDWTQVPRGSTMRAVLDTDVYGGARPRTFDARVLDLRVDVPDDGGRAQVQWGLAEVLET